MNEEKQEDRFHCSSQYTKAKYCPLIKNRADMTHGKFYDVIEKKNDSNRLVASNYLVENDKGEKVWLKSELFDDVQKEPTLNWRDDLIVEDDNEIVEKMNELRKVEVGEIEFTDELQSLSGIDDEEVVKKVVSHCRKNSACDRKIFADPTKETLGSGLEDIDVILAKVAEIFPSTDPVYPSLNPESVTSLLKKRMGYDFSMDGDFLIVNGMTTKFTKDSIDTAHRGLKCILGPKKATSVLTKVIQSQLEKIF